MGRARKVHIRMICGMFGRVINMWRGVKMRIGGRGRGVIIRMGGRGRGVEMSMGGKGRQVKVRMGGRGGRHNAPGMFRAPSGSRVLQIAREVHSHLFEPQLLKIHAIPLSVGDNLSMW